ncbi:endonuclease/exonuclease/phosphatase family protein [Dawidia soli]|uniref:Endonuclease/exonuclease/phosphatase family protein n=1 Tax=Dawidia soli TaxID=2782352 RepID=A0AAP2DCE2_9BACT|nr:endonuclease/exonuclease/phosphatase family protein [Dawidia soli]MBT1688802.1 endonuclease/exonuclease/phosphatase family protein [Dawidia soli]
MKNKLIVVLLALILAGNTFAQTLRVATYNMRYDNPGDSLNRWKYRLPIIIDQVKFHDFDLLGGQELLSHQVEGLMQQLSGYEYAGVGRDDGEKKGEFSALFYKKDKFKLLKKGNFWLSQTPDKPGPGWDAALSRICTWVQLEEKATGLRFYFFNTHFDHRGVQARKESGKLIAEKIAQIAGDAPVVLTGDFNFDEQHEGFAAIVASGKLRNSFNLAPIKLANIGTFNSFDVATTNKVRIDHIFVTSQFNVKKYGILTDNYGGRFPSDHFPVVVELTPVGTRKAK